MMEDNITPKQTTCDPATLRARMKRVFKDFVEIEALNEEEQESRDLLEKELRRVMHSWEFVCGMAEGINILTRLYPLTDEDVVFKLTARLVMCVTAKLGLEAIQEAEDSESFPEELDE